MAENCVFVVKMRGSFMGNKKLTAVGIWSGIGHGKYSRALKCQAGNKFIPEFISRTTGAISKRVSSLDHEVGNNPVKRKPIVKWPCRPAFRNHKILGPFCQTHKVDDCQRGFFKLQRNSNRTSGCNNAGIKSIV